MLKIDTDKMIISVTRGDTFSIVFSAVTGEGNTFVPVDGDVLTFGVAKKLGATPIIQKSNVMDGDTEAFWTITISDDDWIVDGQKLKTGDYVFDVELTTATGRDTIIGKTDEISPAFRVWGEVSEYEEEE